MKALILAAGYGTRLGDIVKNTPKALLEIGSKPIIDHILDHIKEIPGLSEVIVVTNDKFYGTFNDWAKAHGSVQAFELSVVNDGTKSNEDRLGSIGDIGYVLKKRAIEEDLLVIGGDNLFDFNIIEYVTFASEKVDKVTIGTFNIQDISQANKFGVVELQEDKKISSFEEKPENPKSSLIAMCLYYFPKKTLGLIGDYLVQSGKSDRAGDYIIWLKNNSEVFGFEFNGQWFDIGSVESYNEAQEAFTT